MLTPPQLPSVHHNLSCDGCARVYVMLKTNRVER